MKTVYVNVSIAKQWLVKVSVEGDDIDETEVADAAFETARLYVADEIEGGALSEMDKYGVNLAPRPKRGTEDMVLDAAVEVHVDTPYEYQFSEDDPGGRA